VKQLDKPNQGPEERYFIYHPRYSRASDLGESLAPLLGGSTAALGNLSRDTRSALGAQGMVRGDGTQAGTVGQQGTAGGGSVFPITPDNVLRREAGARSTASEAISVKGEGVTLSVDPRSNTLIFYTTGTHYQTLLPMVQRLDVPPKQILLETMIAEVTLTGEFAYGVEFAFTEGNLSGGTVGGLNLPSGGLALNWIEGISQQVRIKLSASNTLVNVLSNPTLVVRDGVEASIKVGNDVPTVGATASDPIQSETQITQVLYRKTGLDLRIRPTINAEGVVVMEINQSISNTVPGASDVAGAPVFFERAVTTEVVARSGESILLAGLISERKNDNSAKVPGFGDIPGIGYLFRSDSKAKERTELVVLITPRVIEDPKEWNEIRIGMQGALQNLELPEPTAAAPVSGGGTTDEPARPTSAQPSPGDTAWVVRP
jgi:general secretion pathway protein D